jgi:hypothetical protein
MHPLSKRLSRLESFHTPASPPEATGQGLAGLLRLREGAREHIAPWDAAAAKSAACPEGRTGLAQLLRERQHGCQDATQ